MKPDMSQIRATLAQAFLPLKCDCEGPDGSLTIKIYDEKSGRVDLLVVGVDPSKIFSVRQLSELIAELRCEISAVTVSSGLSKQRAFG